MNERVAVVQELLRCRRLDAVILDDLTQCLYLLEAYVTIAPGEARVAALVTRHDVTLVADAVSLDRLASVLPAGLAVRRGDGHAFMLHGRRYRQELRRLLRQQGLRRVAAASTAYRDVVPDGGRFHRLADNPLLELAETRTPREVDLLEQAAAIADRVYAAIVPELREGQTEIEVRARLDTLLHAEGADLPSFGTLVSFGEHTGHVHAPVTDRALRRGDLVMLDFGARVGGVGSDLTRTFVFGRATPAQRRMWHAVAAAQQRGLDLVRAGRRASTVAKAVRRQLRRDGHGDHYPHGLGHQLGLLHGPTVLTVGCDRPLREGMALTVEPGAYTSAGGVRLEDDVLVTETGCRVLTRAPRRLQVRP
jgi:Xaa-Pro aminopeptidase